MTLPTSAMSNVRDLLASDLADLPKRVEATADHVISLRDPLVAYEQAVQALRSSDPLKEQVRAALPAITALREGLLGAIDDSYVGPPIGFTRLWAFRESRRRSCS